MSSSGGRCATDTPTPTPGPPGLDGDDGEDGAQGPPGRDGRDGTNGRDGRDGRDGAPGLDGEDGADGERGPKGDKGDKGDAGTPGRDGRDGAPGIDGEDGQDGEDGRPGNSGIFANFTQWDFYQPTLVASTLVFARYSWNGHGMMLWWRLVATAAGTAGNEILVGPVPITPYESSVVQQVGTFEYVRASGAVYKGDANLLTTGYIRMIRADDATSSASVGLQPSFAVASGDVCFGAIFFPTQDPYRS